jgi:hypothetical protein
MVGIEQGHPVTRLSAVQIALGLRAKTPGNRPANGVFSP